MIPLLYEGVPESHFFRGVPGNKNKERDLWQLGYAGRITPPIWPGRALVPAEGELKVFPGEKVVRGTCTPFFVTVTIASSGLLKMDGRINAQL